MQRPHRTRLFSISIMATLAHLAGGQSLPPIPGFCTNITGNGQVFVFPEKPIAAEPLELSYVLSCYNLTNVTAITAEVHAVYGLYSTNLSMVMDADGFWVSEFLPPAGSAQYALTVRDNNGIVDGDGTNRWRFQVHSEWFVNAAALPGGDGTVGQPFHTIQAAIDAANPGDFVIVQDGIYRGVGNKNLSFHGKDLFLESENGRDSTFIDCEGEGRAFHIHQGETTNLIIRGFTITGANTGVVNYLSYGTTNVWVDYGEFSSAILCETNSGFTVEASRFLHNRASNFASYQSGSTTNNMGVYETFSSDGAGGAIHLVNGHAVIRDCEFVENVAGLFGGAIAVVDDSTLVIESSIFQGNNSDAAKDSDTYVVGEDGEEGFFLHADSTVGNGRGGAVYLSQSDAEIRDSRFEDNRSGQGGGIWAESVSSLILEDAYFEANVASSTDLQAGGGGGLAVTQSSLVLEGALFRENHAGGARQTIVIQFGVPEGEGFFQISESILGGGYGGGLLLIETLDSTSIRNADFEGNGVGLAGAGLALINCSNVEVADSRFASNSITETSYGLGGGIFLTNSSLYSTDVTLEGNHVSRNDEFTKIDIGQPLVEGFYQSSTQMRASGCGGGIAAIRSELIGSNLLFRNNLAGESGGGILSHASTVSLYRVAFSNNHSLGGGIHNTTIITIVGIETLNETVASNPFGQGGGLWARDSRIQLTAADIQGNHAGEKGSGIFVEGENAIRLESSLFLRNNLGITTNTTITRSWEDGEILDVTTNTNPLGDGTMVVHQGHLEAVNVTWVDNQGPEDSRGLVLDGGATANVLNSIHWDGPVRAVYPSSFGTAWSIFPQPTPGLNMIAGDPWLDANGRPMVGSPAIDAGNLMYVLESVDVMGDVRRQGPTVDVGAYEFGVSCEIAILPGSLDVGHEGGESVVQVIASANHCRWEVATSEPWIEPSSVLWGFPHVYGYGYGYGYGFGYGYGHGYHYELRSQFLSGSSPEEPGQGDGMILFETLPNHTSLSRAGYLLVADERFRVLQQGNPDAGIPADWLAQHGLPANGSANHLDLDLDGFTTWEEWLAGTDPTDPESLLVMTEVTDGIGLDDREIVLTWPSSEDRLYRISISTNLISSSFIEWSWPVHGQPGFTVYTSSVPSELSPLIFRIDIP